MSDACLNWGKFYRLETNNVAGAAETRLAITDEVVEGVRLVRCSGLVA
jgi:hypothetical protein